MDVGRVGPDRRLAVIDDHITCTSSDLLIQIVSLMRALLTITTTNVYVQLNPIFMKLQAVARSRIDHKHCMCVGIDSQIGNCVDT